MCFDRIAPLYDLLTRWSGRGKRYARKIAVHANVRKSHHILDVGGGTGAIAKHLAPHVHSVVVLDPSKEMLSHAPSSVKKVTGIAQHMPFKNNAFDVVYCVDALHHFSNNGASVETGVKEMLRVLKPGGSIVIVEFNPHTIRGKAIVFFENTLLRWKSTFYSPHSLATLFSPHTSDIFPQGHEYILHVRKQP